jgi:GntR family transcriptional regulator, transcriptional repressor for pyruvate dehydrogenase complex
MKTPAPRPQKMAEHIAEQLRGQIVRRELADGDYLPVEAELSEFFDTSRPTMREAFRILEVEGLLHIRRGGRFGPQVCAPDPAVTARNLGLLLQYKDVELSDVYDAFLDIVPTAARRLAEQHTEADLERLRQQRARCEAAVDDASALLDESTEFSLLIVELAGNQVLAVLSRLLAEVVRAHRQAMSAYFEAKPGVRAKRANDVLEITATVIDMIEAGDAHVEERLRESLDSIQRKALRIPVRNPVQLV